MKPQIKEQATEIDRSFGIGKDYDVTRSGDWVGVFDKGHGKHQVVRSDAHLICLPDGLRYPIVRFLGSDNFLVVDSRTDLGRPNGMIINREGTVRSTFLAGDAIDDVVVLGDLIAVTYFDEGVFGEHPPSNEGIAFFDFEGRFVWGYRTGMAGSAVDISDCYCAVRVNHSTLAFSAYQTFDIVRIRPHERSQVVNKLPEELHGAGALTTRRESVYLFSPREYRGAIVGWEPGAPPVEIAHRTGPMRGLEYGRFISYGDYGFTVLEIVTS